MGSCCRVSAATRSLLQFLKQRETRLTEPILLEWLKQRLETRGLEAQLVGLTEVAKFARTLEEKGQAEVGVVQRVRKRTDLLAVLPGGRPLVPSRWGGVLVDFEKDLVGYAPLHQARILGNAARFLWVLDEHEREHPDGIVLLSWLNLELAKCSVGTVYLSFPRVERFLQYLVEQRGCPTNPATEWRKSHRELREALLYLKQGLEPPSRLPRHQSFLTPHIERFILFKKSLGRKYESLTTLEVLGVFAEEKGVHDVGELNTSLLLAFIASRGWRRSTKKTFQGSLRQFFRFLFRTNQLPTEALDPTDFLPHQRRPPRPPYIFSVQEIARLLAALADAPTHPFNRQTYTTMVFLLYACGLRRRESLRLLVQDFDPVRATIFIRRTKFDKDRLIPVGPRVCERLSEYQRCRAERLGDPSPESPFFVQSHGAPVSSLLQVFRGACKRAQIGSEARPKPRLHDLRHSFAVHRLYKWYLEDADPQSRLPRLSIYMGHVSSEYTRHYLHLSQDLLRVAGRTVASNLEDMLLTEREGGFS